MGEVKSSDSKDEDGDGGAPASTTDENVSSTDDNLSTARDEVNANANAGVGVA